MYQDTFSNGHDNKVTLSEKSGFYPEGQDNGASCKKKITERSKFHKQEQRKEDSVKATMIL